MKFFIKIVIADVFILLIQAMLLFLWIYKQEDYPALGVLIYFIFTIKDKTILFLNPPILIFTLYIHLFLKHKTGDSILKYSIVGILNFILLYCISWIEMLMLVSLKFKV